jgi:manganese-dependent inorganic pyrophosphatase
MLHYQAFARCILERINPHKKGVIPTSIHHLLASMHAQPVLVFDPDRIFKGMIAIAASTLESFIEILQAEPAENMIVIVGDREDVQREVIQRGVRAVIITNGKALGSGLKELAERKRVSVIISPFDTSSTALLTIYSSPVKFMGDTTVRPVNVRDPIRRIRVPLSDSAARCLPVVDDTGRVVGVISKGDLINEPNIEVILVDHNELSQAVEGVENCRILEVVDHQPLRRLHVDNHRRALPRTACPDSEADRLAVAMRHPRGHADPAVRDHERPGPRDGGVPVAHHRP